MGATHTQGAGLPAYSALRGWLIVAVLSLAAIVSFIDRQVINLLVDPIKADLGLTDVQISLLQGFSFALLYAVMAIPLAWLADRTNRKWVIIAGLVCWSLATFSSGLATGFAMLFVARMVVGVGEATLSPAGFSIISDSFPPEKIPGATSVFTGAGFIGSGLALIVGGYFYARLVALGPQALPFGTFEPWQMTFMVVALLSVPLFFLLLLIPEPVRRETALMFTGRADLPDAEAKPPSAFEVFGFLRRNAGIFLPLMLGFACFAAAQFGIGAWAPSYFIRVHGWTPLMVGQAFGPVVMVAGLSGVVCGGFLAQRRLAAGQRDATIRLPLYAIALALPLAIAFPLMPHGWLALVLLGAVLFLGTIPFGAGVATFPLITPNRIRGQVIAVYLLAGNLIGYSAGPLFVALLNDNFFPAQGGIARSLSIAPPLTMILGLALVSLALKPFHRMLEKGRVE